MWPPLLNRRPLGTRPPAEPRRGPIINFQAVGSAIETLVAVARRPWLYGTAVRQWRALTPPGWWRRWPRVPEPSPAYLEFRLVTMYGSPEAKPSPEELVGYLEWCRWLRAQAR